MINEKVEVVQQKGDDWIIPLAMGLASQNSSETQWLKFGI